MLEDAKAENGGIVLPDSGSVFSSWDPNHHLKANRGEKTIIMAQPLHLYGSLPESEDKGVDQVFDYSRMTGRYFKPDDRICLIIDNTDYSSIRWTDGRNYFDNLIEFGYSDNWSARDQADLF